MSGEPCCLNCKYWQIDTQLFGPADGVICRAGYGHTAPYDCCDEFRREFDDFVMELDFVMEENGKLIGQNIFMKAVINADDGRDIPIMTMGPICIAPELKRKGYGKLLLDYSLEKAVKMGCGALCTESATQGS